MQCYCEAVVRDILKNERKNMERTAVRISKPNYKRVIRDVESGGGKMKIGGRVDELIEKGYMFEDIFLGKNVHAMHEQKQ
jgi:hypothetical protein